MKNSSYSALRLALFYGLFGGLWVAASDRILEMLVADPHRITIIQTYKGWTFVAAGALLIYLLLRKELRMREGIEEALRRSEVKYHTMIETANDAIFIYDADTKVILYANKKTRGLLDRAPEEIVGKHLSELHPGEEAERYAGALQRVVETGEPITGEFVVCCRDGGKVPVEISVNIMELGGKKVLQGIFRDITERKRAEERIGRQLRMLDALRTIDVAITSILDLRLTLDIFLKNVIEQSNFDAADVLLLNPHLRLLEYAAGKGFRSEAIKNSRLLIGEGYAGSAAMERRMIHIRNLSEAWNAFVRAPRLEGEDFVSYLAFPLIARGEVKGVLEIFHRSVLDPGEEGLRFLEAMATQAAIAIDNDRLFEDLRHSNIELAVAYDATLEGWGRALELRDEETEGHTERVTAMVLRLAREMGITEGELVHIRRGAYLHDIGKIGIPDRILLKKEPLTEEEWKTMRRHPEYAFKIIQPIRFLRPALDIPYCHHERWDGTGYPRGLKGEQIPLAARIFAVVDVWDALTTKRRYHPAWPGEKAREHIRSLAGTHLDPNVVEAFLSLLKV